jgi:lysyl-tRNA synthetase, class II
LDRLDELRRVRMEKLAQLRELGENPYPYSFDRSQTAREVIDGFAELEEKGTVRVAGRIMSLREMGKAAFAHLQDATGRIQIYLKQDIVGADRYAILKLLDLGDLVGVEGVVFRTRTGEISVRAERFSVLCKSILPLPIIKEKDGERFDDITDKELRYRQRHTDLILNPAARRSLETRTRVVRHLRSFLDERDFLEVETPILQSIPGGANARPFITHHNALSMDLFLRIALELHLKRLLVGGIERVYELSRVFRNEGMDREHNPEFTLLEFYWAYADYNDAMTLVEEMFRSCALEAAGALRVRWGDHEIDLESPFRRVTMRDLVLEHAGLDILRDEDDRLSSWLSDRGRPLPKHPGRGPLIEYVFDAAAVPNLIQPTFVMDHPRSISPLAKQHRSGDPALVERFELFIGGNEYANAFSELNDPVDQRARLEEQAARRSMGDEEAQFVDEEFLTAIEHGMPPAAGVGIGVDRLVMLLTGEANIRDVLFFPHLKPLDGAAREAKEEE